MWRQDHNGFTHQDPGFIDLAGNKSGEVVRVYLHVDANCLLAVAEAALLETNVCNIIVSDKQSHLQTSTSPRPAPTCQRHRPVELGQQRRLRHRPG